LATLNFGVRVNLIILDPVILAFLLPTTLKRYFIQFFAARYFRELARLAKFANKGHAKKRVLQYLIFVCYNTIGFTKFVLLVYLGDMVQYA